MIVRWWLTTSSLLIQDVSSFSVQCCSLHAFHNFLPLSPKANPATLVIIANSAMPLVVMTVKGEMHMVVEVKVEIGMHLCVITRCATIGMLWCSNC